MRFVQQPWTAEIMAILAVLFKLVLSGSQEAFDMGLRALKDTSSGALCEVQVMKVTKFRLKLSRCHTHVVHKHA